MLEEIFNDSGFDKSRFNSVFLGISEAVINAIVHGNKLDIEKHVFLEICLTGEELIVEIEDEGDGFQIDGFYDPTSFENRKVENGRGIFLIRYFAEELVYMNSGNRVRIKYKLN